jgi:hypothetical protein
VAVAGMQGPLARLVVLECGGTSGNKEGNLAAVSLRTISTIPDAGAPQAIDHGPSLFFRSAFLLFMQARRRPIVKVV